MEVIYKRLYGLRWTVFEYWIIYLISVVMNYLGERDVLGGEQTFWQKILDLANPPVFILVVLTVTMGVFYALLAISGFYTRKQEPAGAFTDLMKAYSDEHAHARVSGGFVWGEDRTLWTAPNMVIGIEPQRVHVVEYSDKLFRFEDRELQAACKRFEKSKAFESTRALGNNLPRFMLTKYSSNFNKEDPALSLQLRKTSWAQCQFVWHNRYPRKGNTEEKQREWTRSIVAEHMNSGLKVANYPNSLCLHLIIETKNGNVLITEISKEKANDYPTTKAVSIGEQLELADFLDQRDFQTDFVSEWTRRAVCEEFGLSEDQYEKVFDQKSLRVLALDLEMDIYNFSLVCVIRLNQSCEQFKRLVNSTIEQKEISDIGEMDPDEIPAVLMEYPKNKNEYHPSSYLRLLLFYVHRNGHKRTCKAFMRAKKPRVPARP